MFTSITFSCLLTVTTPYPYWPPFYWHVIIFNACIWLTENQVVCMNTMWIYLSKTTYLNEENTSPFSNSHWLPVGGGVGISLISLFNSWMNSSRPDIVWVTADAMSHVLFRRQHYLTAFLPIHQILHSFFLISCSVLWTSWCHLDSLVRMGQPIVIYSQHFFSIQSTKITWRLLPVVEGSRSY